MTTPERVAELLREDDRLTDEQRTALAELFRVAYEQLVTRHLSPVTEETDL